MSRPKISAMCAFRVPIPLRKVIDEAVKKEDSNFTNFMRDAVKLKLEQMGIEY